MTVSATTSTTGTATTTGSTAADITSGQSSLNQTYQSFLTLLTTQLQNQDPLSPMDTNTFTQQLVSMNGVQQQLLTNNLLQQMVSQATGAGSVGSAVSLIGKQVTSQSSVQALQNGAATWTYTLPSAATNASVEVLDANGNVVWSGNAPSTAAGSTSFTWNGQTSSGSTLTSGNYTLGVAATDSTGAAITPTISIAGVASGVSTSGGVTQVDIGSVPVAYSTITSVTNTTN
ncbi:MAG TPA: flagellar hook capping FlgD N-terminal domain-containing protein [Caulobacteraceae bacterium]|nr:flagellar hook capping FlgD N-terminal domain-containing protein [Caulobacteraceae bacterium]